MAKYISEFTGIEIDERLSKVNEEFTSEEKEKLAALENYDDSEVLAAVEDKVDKVEGKGLSTNDFTNEEKDKLSTLENYDDSGITKSIEDLEENKANKSEVYNKEETDTKITEKVAEIVAGAPEEFNTLKEMSDWLTEHEDSAATMNTAILKNKEDIAANTEAIEENTADIEQNKSDISSAEKAIKINQRTLGTQATKNVLKTNKINQTKNGITAITNDDGSIHVTGTSTDLTYFGLYSGFTVPESANYILSGCPTGGGNEHYMLYLTGDTEMYDQGKGVTGYIEASHKMTVYIFIAENKTVDLMFYPMLRNANITDNTYEPYKPSVNERLTANENDIAINRATLGIQCINIFDGNLRQGGIQSTNGTFYVADDSVASGNFIKVSKNATISISRTVSGGYLVWRFYDKDKNYIGYGSDNNVQIISGGSGFHMPSENSKFACFKLVNPNIVYAKFVDSTNSLANTYTIVEGEYTANTMPAYEPYVPSVNERLTANEKSIIINRSTIGFQSKNILKNHTEATVQEHEGITYTINADGTIIANGTTGSKPSYCSLGGYFEIAETNDFILNGCATGGGDGKWALQLYKQATPNDAVLFNDYGSGYSGKIEKGIYRGLIVIRANRTATNLTFKPMLRLKGTDDTYVPYVPTVNERLTTNENDILSVANNVTTTNAKAGTSTTNTLSSVGWHRIFAAERQQFARSGILMINRAFGSREPESHTILFNITQGRAVLELLNKNVEKQSISKLRLVHANSSPQSKACFIDIYYNETGENKITSSVFCESIVATGAGSNFMNSRFVASNLSADIPEGYTSTELSLTNGDFLDRLEALETALAQIQTQ